MDGGSEGGGPPEGNGGGRALGLPLLLLGSGGGTALGKGGGTALGKGGGAALGKGGGAAPGKGGGAALGKGGGAAPGKGGGAARGKGGGPPFGNDGRVAMGGGGGADLGDARGMGGGAPRTGGRLGGDEAPGNCDGSAAGSDVRFNLLDSDLPFLVAPFGLAAKPGDEGSATEARDEEGGLDALLLVATSSGAKKPFSTKASRFGRDLKKLVRSEEMTPFLVAF